MPSFARVIVNVPTVGGVFDYRLPPDLEGKVGSGHLVTVPFGKQTVQGVVFSLVAEPSVQETKDILGLVDSQPVVTAAQIALAQWLAEETLSPLTACVGLMLPAGLAQQADVLYRTADDRLWTVNNSSQSVIGCRLLELLQTRGPLRGRQIDRHFAKVDWRRTAQSLVRSGALDSQSVLPPSSVRPKFVRRAQLAVPPEQAEAALPGLGKTPATLARRQAALRVLMREPVEVDVSWVYAESGCNLADLQELAERELILLRETETWRDPVQGIKPEEAGDREIQLTPEQTLALKEILRALGHFPPFPSPFLLHGVTGSGKTEIYIRAAQEIIRQGRQAIILVPEIALTPQTVQRFLERFPGQVGLVHSRLSAGERYDTWRRARLGLLKVVIGPRSALFAPLPNIGLIAVDECHDSSYYQSEPPFYSAVSAAMAYARLCGAVCVLGSATPPVALRYGAKIGEVSEGGLRLLELPERVERRSMPQVQIVDMREELKSNSRGIFSRRLIEQLTEVLQRGQQAILFLNRRGTATYVFCRECGYVAKCPQCDTPLTYHVESQKLQVEGQNDLQLSTFDLRCHRCGYRRQMLKVCPACKSNQIRACGLGSERVEAEVQALFPSARTLRWDWETTRQKDAHEIILSHFVAHRTDVLIGTQMLAKGLDLPLVTFVGIVLADVGLNLPDPFAAERTFDVLTQVAGRAGRSSLGGCVVLQTFQPEHYVIQAAAGHDYAAFYGRELEERRRLGYPPFGRLARLEYRHLEAAKAEAEARRVAERLSVDIQTEGRTETDLIGPVPCFFGKLDGWYRWQIVLRGPDPVSLLRGRRLEGWRVEVDPASLL